jgi:formylglycine-generating enzyme required for sulfatase activity
VSSVPCTAPPRVESGAFDEELCLPGGGFVLGDRRTEHLLADFDLIQGSPERIAQVSPFRIDRYEVSVGRFRAAMRDAARPFVPPEEPTRRDAPLACGTLYPFDYRFCTWSGADAPSDADADAMPINCVTQETARAFCRWAGGDLPTEAQWEYAAAQSSRVVKSILPWGEEVASCAAASYGRFLSAIGASECGLEASCGPLRVDAPFAGGPRPAGCVGAQCVRDETPGPGGKGIIGMAGNVAEWVRDVRISYDSPCWRSAPRLDPVCENPADAPESMYRGGSWATGSWLLSSALRSGGIAENSLLAAHGVVGFRCVRSGASP